MVYRAPFSTTTWLFQLHSQQPLRLFESIFNNHTILPLLPWTTTLPTHRHSQHAPVSSHLYSELQSVPQPPYPLPGTSFESHSETAVWPPWLTALCTTINILRPKQTALTRPKIRPWLCLETGAGYRTENYDISEYRPFDISCTKIRTFRYIGISTFRYNGIRTFRYVEKISIFRYRTEGVPFYPPPSPGIPVYFKQILIETFDAWNIEAV